MKYTAIAPANIAFIKYWGKKDAALRLPLSSSLSMNLSAAQTTTTVEFLPTLPKDEIVFVGETVSEKEKKRMVDHLDRLRSAAKSTQHARVMTKNSFPKGTGLASSASGFAALTVAGANALKLQLSEKELTMFARLGSGSACRSIPDGYVVWEAGSSSDTSFAHSVFPASHWGLYDVVAIVEASEKEVSSTDGMEAIETSPLWKARNEGADNRLARAVDAIKQRNLTALGEVMEEDCLLMHAVMLTQKHPLLYWNHVTVLLLHALWSWRANGLPVYATIDAGPNVHCVCEPNALDEIVEKLRSIAGVRDVLINQVAQGAHGSTDHLF